ncbi:hypothetical protein RRG08_033134 [Elysia crispata]|uniref:Uncharacterized protein n=1 Tax=Elysia crispata TaxID=231223 RepID=A0AAE1DT86_9GAST|nr:hypothetical protein RRG08_033134 [Elysia crispata]
MNLFRRSFCTEQPRAVTSLQRRRREEIRLDPLTDELVQAFLLYRATTGEIRPHSEIIPLDPLDRMNLFRRSFCTEQPRAESGLTVRRSFRLIH